MALLTRTQILEAKDIESLTVPVPEWGGDVLVFALTGRERDEFESSIVITRGKTSTVSLDNIRAKLCALAIRDVDGRRLFEEEDIEALGQKSALALTRVFEAARGLSGLTDTDVKELTKN